MEEKCTMEKQQQLLDGISELPNDILVLILSFLTVEDALRTSVLSKRWLHLWLSVSTLNFDSRKLWEGLEKPSEGLERPADISKYQILLERNRGMYVKWVNWVLLQQSHHHQSNNNALDVFRIRFDLSISSQNDIDKWLHYAFSRGAQRLDLNLSDYNNLGCHDPYAFPQHLLSNPIFFGFKSLRSLKFHSVNVSGKALEFFLHNCPFLESLIVKCSYHWGKLDIRGPSLALKHLEITYCELFLTIFDTNLVSLKVTDYERLQLKNNVPMLLDVYIVGFFSKWNSLFRFVLGGLSAMASNLDVLTLQETLTLYEGFSLNNNSSFGSHILPKLKQFLCLGEDASLISFTSLIRAAPNLGTFVLKCGCDGMLPQQQQQQQQEVGKRKCRVEKKEGDFLQLKHLKVVEFRGYFGARSQWELMEYFVENAALQRIVVDTRIFLQFPYCGDLNDEPEKEADPIFRNQAKQQLQGFLDRLASHVELLVTEYRCFYFCK